MERTLSDYAKSKSNFVSLKDGESYMAVYKGFKFIEKESFGETKEYARYLLMDLEDGIVRNFDSMSGSLANRVDEIEIGTRIKITRAGEKMDTKYDVEIVVADKEIPVVE